MAGGCVGGMCGEVEGGGDGMDERERKRKTRSEGRRMEDSVKKERERGYYEKGGGE